MDPRRHYVTLLDEARGRVLAVAADDGALHLPEVPGRWPGHRDLVAAAGASTAYAEIPATWEPDGTVTSWLVGDTTSTLAGATWLPLEEVARAGVAPATAARLTRHLADRAARRAGAAAGDDGLAAWYRPGWRDEVTAWVGARGAEHGYEPAGPPEATVIWMLSAVLRFPVRHDGRDADLWFKATCEGFRTEAALTRAVAGLAPDLLPRLVAVDAERAWQLMEPLPPDQDERADRAPVAARALARLQLAATGALDDLRAAGLADRGLEQTLAGLRTVLHDSVEADRMGPDLLAEAAASEDWLAGRLRALWEHGLPDTLNHGDLHLGNVAWDGDRPVLYDWTNACLTHPFLDAHHLADSAAEQVEAEEGKHAARLAVREAYVEPWRAAYPGVDVDAVWDLAGLAEDVLQAISYEQIARAQPAEERWALAGVVARVVERLCAQRRAARG